MLGAAAAASPCPPASGLKTPNGTPRLDIDPLIGCLLSTACIVTHATSGLIIGLLLFLVAVGLTLIFGVLKIVNFAHGAFYMLGAYFALTIIQFTDSYLLAFLGAATGTAAVGLVFERLFISQVYGRNVLMQLLVCYAFVLIFDDLVRIIWGSEFRSMGMPDLFQGPPFFIAGGVVPQFYLFLIVVTLAIAAALGLALARSRLGKTVRAAAINPGMVSALGINTELLYGLVFALGGLLAGLAGALAAPVRSLTPGMGFSVLIESFIVTVIGGMGSILGALVGAILIGLIRSFGSLGFPLFTDGLMYLFMIIILVVKPTGLFGKPVT
jgi:branched-chain amino acid transport system permease protein